MVTVRTVRRDHRPTRRRDRAAVGPQLEDRRREEVMGVYGFAVICFALAAFVWIGDVYEKRFYDDYVAKCDAQHGRVVRMPVRGEKDWIQCVRGLGVIKI